MSLPMANIHSPMSKEHDWDSGTLLDSLMLKFQSCCYSVASITAVQLDLLTHQLLMDRVPFQVASRENLTDLTDLTFIIRQCLSRLPQQIKYMIDYLPQHWWENK